MMRTAISSALANGLNNSIQNQKGKFKPLAKPLALLKCPKRMLYPLATFEDISTEDGLTETLERDFTKVARLIDYEKRIAQASKEPTR